MSVQNAAEAALSLNGHEMEAGMALSVAISDPGRKKERTDAGSRELRVTGVSKGVVQKDLETLFEKVRLAFPFQFQFSG